MFIRLPKIYQIIQSLPGYSMFSRLVRFFQVNKLLQGYQGITRLPILYQVNQCLTGYPGIQIFTRLFNDYPGATKLSRFIYVTKGQRWVIAKKKVI
jgi:hypothetical protein